MLPPSLAEHDQLNVPVDALTLVAPSDGYGFEGVVGFGVALDALMVIGAVQKRMPFDTTKKVYL